MSDVNIHIDETSLELSGSNTVTGKICWIVGEAYFPEQQWNDFVVVILIWWLQSLLTLLKDNNTSAIYDFMDGPFSVRSSKKDDNGQMLLEFVERHQHGETIIFTEVGNLQQIGDSLISVSEKLVSAIKSRDWHPHDIDKLESHLASLKAAR